MAVWARRMQDVSWMRIVGDYLQNKAVLPIYIPYCDVNTTTLLLSHCRQEVYNVRMESPTIPRSGHLITCKFAMANPSLQIKKTERKDIGTPSEPTLTISKMLVLSSAYHCSWATNRKAS